MNKIAVVNNCTECPFLSIDSQENGGYCNKLNLSGKLDKLCRVCPLPNEDAELTPEEKAEKNELLLKLMTHVYDEDERRNELVDSKNSQMIVLTGAMVTLQSTFIGKLLVDTLFLNPNIVVGYWWKWGLSGLLLLSTVGYFVAMYNFINAYIFKDNYCISPDHESIIETMEDNSTKQIVIEDMLYVYDESIRENDKIINKKISTGRDGFLFLRFSVGLTIVFLSLFILIFIC